jgi:hypothetical protein
LYFLFQQNSSTTKKVNTNKHERFSLKKLAVAKGLNEGLINGSYVEAVLISCGLLSGIASEIWPGENIDRKRFIELLVKYDNSNLASRISLPLIINDSSVFPNRQLAINC